MLAPVVLLTVLAAPPPQEVPPERVVAELAALVDLPTRDLRRQRAAELAGLDVSLARWHEAALRLPLRDTAPTLVDGQNRCYRVQLPIGPAERPAEIHVRVPIDLGKRTGPLPLLFVWPSAGRTGADALAEWTPLADRFGFLLAAPTETYELYRKDGWSYHPDAYEGLFEALRFVRRHFDVDEDRIVLAGVGGGGHATWDVGARAGDRFAALVPANGAPRLGNAPREHNLVFLEQIAHVPIRLVRWGEIEALQEANIERALELLRGFRNDRVQVDRATERTAALAGTAPGWSELMASRRQVPDRLVRYADVSWAPPLPDWGRCHWLEILRTDGRAVTAWPTKLPARWLKLDDKGRRRFLEDHLRDGTARLVAVQRAPGRFAIEDRGIERFRLLLTADRIDPGGKVVVEWRGHRIEKAAAPAVRPFLVEFAERFDRTFLPTAEVVLP